jgi:hypothetical protein
MRWLDLRRPLRCASTRSDPTSLWLGCRGCLFHGLRWGKSLVQALWTTRVDRAPSNDRVLTRSYHSVILPTIGGPLAQLIAAKGRPTPRASNSIIRRLPRQYEPWSMARPASRAHGHGGFDLVNWSLDRAESARPPGTGNASRAGLSQFGLNGSRVLKLPSRLKPRSPTSGRSGAGMGHYLCTDQ